MKIRILSLLPAATLCAALVQPVSAATVDDYLEKFDNVLVTPAKSFVLKYWTRHVPADWQRHTYSNPGEGGHDGAWLGSSYSSYDDYIISPEVEGAIAFYGKLTDPSGQIDVYEAVADGDGWTLTAANVTGMEGIGTDSWTRITLDIPAGGGRHIAFKLNAAGIDEFSAAKAMLNDVRALKIEKALAEKDAISVQLDAQSCTSFDLAVTLTNSGTVDMTADDYTVDFYLGTYSEPMKVKVGEARPGAIVAASLQTFTVPVTLTVPESEWNQPRYITAVESVSGTAMKVSQKTLYSESQFNSAFIPYLPVAGITGGGDKPISGAFGMGRAEAGTAISRTLYIINTAATAPLTVTGISAEGGFSLSGDKAFTIEAGQMKGIEIGFTSATEGRHTGKVIISSVELPDFEWPVEVLVTPADLRNYGFDDATGTPDGFVADNAWVLETLPPLLSAHEGDRAMGIMEYSQKTLVTPRLRFADGEKLYFDIAARKPSGRVEVSVSADRINWQPAIAVISSNEADAGYRLNTDAIGSEVGSPCYFKPYEVVMPTGEWYVQFSAYGVYLDNVAGGESADSPVDVHFTSWTQPDEAIVNNNCLSTLSLRNLGLPLAEGEYTVSLVIDGREVAYADAPAMESGEAATFEIDYTPHAPLEQVPVCIRFASDDYSVCTPETTLNIKPESDLVDVTIGIISSDSYSDEYPVRVLKRDFRSEAVYPAALLSGLTSGESITSISWIGYSYYGEFGSVNGRVYLANTDDTSAGDAFTATDDMVLVLDGAISIERPDGYDTAMCPFTTAKFDTEFVYTGGGLRVVVEIPADPSISSDYYNYDRYAIDSRYPAACRYVTRGGDESTGSLPVVILTKRIPVAVLSGTVTDAASQQPIVGARVSLRSGEVLYEAVTDDGGAYGMDVYQGTLEYQLTAEAEGYFGWEGDSPVTFGGADRTADIAMREAKVAVFGRLICGGNAVAAGVTATLTPEGGEPSMCDTDASGRFSFETRVLGIMHTLKVESPLFAPLVRDVPVAEEDIDLGDIELTSGASPVSVDGIEVRGARGCIELNADGRAVTVTDSTGRIVAAYGRVDGRLTVGPLAPDVYIVNGIKIMVR